MNAEEEEEDEEEKEAQQQQHQHRGDGLSKDNKFETRSDAIQRFSRLMHFE